MSELNDSIQDYSIKTMTRSELSLVMDWAAAEGWNPGLHDADCFYAADEEGFLIGLLRGEAIAAISAVKYGEAFGFIGFYLVKPAFRGRGYGWQIWQAGLEYLAGRTVGLDGVVAQQENYLKSGFRLAHRNIRYRGVGDGSANGREAGNSLLDGQGELSGVAAAGIVPLALLPIERVVEYDQLLFGSARGKFLSRWIAQPDGWSVGLMNHGELVGYGVLRVCRGGYKIGPLFADTPKFAETIFLALKSHVEPGSAFYLDVPDVNLAAVTMAQKYGMSAVFETARMYRQSVPDLPLNRIFGITTFELG
jgi:GNAT superfamily N-acetyltransferase